MNNDNIEGKRLKLNSLHGTLTTFFLVSRAPFDRNVHLVSCPLRDLFKVKIFADNQRTGKVEISLESNQFT